MAKARKGVVGFWPDEHHLLGAAEKTRKSGFTKFDAITPFAVHGMAAAVGVKRSFIPWVTFIMGLTGLAAGWAFQYYVAAIDWPIIIAGKPFHSLPAFVPVMFELTILFGALSSVLTCFLVCGLPKIDPPVIDPDLTSHKFALFVPDNDTGYEEGKVRELFRSFGATEVRLAEF
jgi:hypothetical protein